MSIEDQDAAGARPPPLLPPDVREGIPALYAVEHEDDPIVRAKFFTPWSLWTWYLIEFDGQDIAFGLVSGHEVELGYFSIAELESIRGPGGVWIERDLYFKPTPLSEVRKLHEPPAGDPGASSVREQEGKRPALPPSPIEQPAIRLAETWLQAIRPGRFLERIDTPTNAAVLLRRLIGMADREHFVVLLLNAQLQVTHAHVVSRGTLKESPVHPREVFKAAVLANAAAVIVGHNHPSGQVTPSQDDLATERRLVRCGKLMGIPVVDALIVGPCDNYFASSAGTINLPPIEPG